MEITSNDIWKAYISSNWQGPMIAGLFTVIAAILEDGLFFKAVFSFIPAALFALVLSHLVSLILGIPLLYALKAANALTKNTILVAGALSGAAFALWFYNEMPIILYPLCALVCGVSAGWFAAQAIFGRPNKSLKSGTAESAAP